MSNNKQTMKLYTEEQMKEAIKMARNGARSEDNIIGSLNFIKPPIELPSDSLCINCDKSESTHNICMDCIIKIGKENIELPSDEEIENLIGDGMHNYYKGGFEEGAKWVKSKIQGDNHD